MAASPHLTLEHQANAFRLRDNYHERIRREKDWDQEMWISKYDMHVLNFDTPQKSRYRSIITTVLLLLCIPFFFYHLAPSFTNASDELISSIATRLRGEPSRAEYCTKEVGDAQCCALYLDATPCIDECRKQHVDRVTFTLTKEYDECADTCLVAYSAACQQMKDNNLLEATNNGS
ncbi:hypothetical protein FB567DRAFT_545488 [Paraphoma chrysanthemicola]|uniref:Uncharacterized protein n=1 Tax=Paraphoma chrysanthemicola TaxID=798071 RepID=A0A8K0REH4_9PLEO|nr:hypothetical protein FB567DRAFT_545488 [Paraphoma chrysanthemicola]